MFFEYSTFTRLFFSISRAKERVSLEARDGNEYQEAEKRAMPVITLIIEIPGGKPPARVEVQANDFVGTCVASLVEKFGYPRQDIAGSPVVYQLRLITSVQPLPNTVRFRDAHVRSGARFTLEAKEANYATIPLVEQPAVQNVIPGRMTRRYFLLWTFAGLSVAGMGLGMTAAFGQRLLVGHSRHTLSNTGSQHLPSNLPRGANMQFAFSTHSQTVRAVEWSPDSTLIGSGGDDAQLFLWDATTGTVQQRLLHPAPVQAFAWSPQGERLVTAAGTQIAFFETHTGTLLARSSHQHTANVLSVAWTPANQRQVVSGGLDKRAVVWGTVAYQPQAVFVKHDTPIEAVSWGPDGVNVASASLGGSVRIWDAETAVEAHGFFQDAQVPMHACAFAPVGTALAVGGNDGMVRIWMNGFLCQQARTGLDGLQCQDTPLRLTPSNTPIRSIAWSPDARYLASGSDDGSFSVWTIEQNQFSLLFTLMASPNTAIHSIAWSPDGSHIATAVGTRVLLWRLHT